MSTLTNTPRTLALTIIQNTLILVTHPATRSLNPDTLWCVRRCITESRTDYLPRRVAVAMPIHRYQPHTIGSELVQVRQAV